MTSRSNRAKDRSSAVVSAFYAYQAEDRRGCVCAIVIVDWIGQCEFSQRGVFSSESGEGKRVVGAVEERPETLHRCGSSEVHFGSTIDAPSDAGCRKKSSMTPPDTVNTSSLSGEAQRPPD
jgi:hypothetical protein